LDVVSLLKSKENQMNINQLIEEEITQLEDRVKDLDEKTASQPRVEWYVDIQEFKVFATNEASAELAVLKLMKEALPDIVNIERVM
jgi:hypothetical protein